MNQLELLENAKTAMKNAFSPYSKFKVGAALLTKSGKLYMGCNVENVSYGAAICAERVAFVKAVSEGELSFESMAIVGSDGNFTFPCGICRQFMAEFGVDLNLIFSNGSEVQEGRLADFLPHSFLSFKSEDTLVS